MRVGYEVTGLELDAAGSARYIESLRQELQRLDEIELVPLRQSGGPNGRVLRGLRRELAYFPFELPRRARKLGLDLLHCTAAVAPVRSSVPTVITLHDVLGLEHPEWFRRALALHSKLVLAPAARRAACVLVPSAHTRERVVSRLQIDPERVRLAPLGIDERFSPGEPADGLRARFSLEGPFVLTVGTLQPRKNVESALHAFERLVADGAKHRLAIVGGRGWRDEPLAELIRKSPAAERIVLTGRVSDEDLVGLYRAATCSSSPRGTRDSAFRRWRRWHAAHRRSRATARACPRWSATRAFSSTRTTWARSSRRSPSSWPRRTGARN